MRNLAGRYTELPDIWIAYTTSTWPQRWIRRCILRMPELECFCVLMIEFCVSLSEAMGRNPALTEYEQGQFDVPRSSKATLRAIAASLKRSPKVVYVYFKNPPDVYGMIKSPERKPKLGLRDVRCIIKAAISGNLSDTAIASNMTPQVSKRAVQRALSGRLILCTKKSSPHPNSLSATTGHGFSWATNQGLHLL